MIPDSKPIMTNFSDGPYAPFADAQFVRHILHRHQAEQRVTLACRKRREGHLFQRMAEAHLIDCPRAIGQELRQHLTPDGVIAINVGRTRTDYQMVDAMARTAAEVFPSVHVIDVAGSLNSIVYATNQPTTLENLRANLNTMPHELLRAIAERALTKVRPLNPEALIFTDDRAPVERLTNEIMLSFLFGVGSGEIKLQ